MTVDKRERLQNALVVDNKLLCDLCASVVYEISH
jgi:hypothetical protein